MRLSRIVPAAALLALLAPPAQAEPPRERVLATKAMWTGGSHPFCLSGSCSVKMQVRAGEQYLHLVALGNATPAAVDVTTSEGVTRVCQTTQSGPLPIAGLQSLGIRAVHDPACGNGVPVFEGRLIAYFAERAVTFAEAQKFAEPDQERKVLSY